MTNQATTEIRRRSDGSIDTEFYVDIARREQASAIHAACQQVVTESKSLGRPFAALRQFFVEAPMQLARR